LAGGEDKDEKYVGCEDKDEEREREIK